jgi:hypothetical protein
MTPVASSSASPASEHVLDQRGASFETAAPQLPQDEGIFLMPSIASLILRGCERIEDPLDRRSASFETAASQLPQDDEFS